MIAEHSFESQDFGKAAQAIHAWRGHCIATFARAERAATEALLRLALRDVDVELPLLVGAKLEALHCALKRCEDPHAPTAIVALSRFRAHDQLRAYLCHGDVKTTLDRTGKWQAVFTLVALLKQRADRTVLVVEETTATSIARALHRDQQRFIVQISGVAATAVAPIALRIGAA
jgi:hypothetical protein